MPAHRPGTSLAGAQRVSEAHGKQLLALEVVLLLLPASALLMLIAALSVTARPLTAYKPLELAFDAALLLALAAFAAAWRLSWLYLRQGRRGLVPGRSAAMALLALGAGIGLAATIVAVAHALGGPPRDSVGFALLSPAAVLSVVGSHLWIERRRAR